jgi:type IV pilus assembly protein PilC
MTDTMVRFRYEGETVEGETVKGEIKAPSSLAARNELALNGTRVSKLTERKGFNMEITKKGVPLLEIMHYCRQMASFMRAGVPVTEAMGSLRDDCDNKQLKIVLDEMIDQIGTGSTVGDAAARHADVFPPYFVAIIRSADLTGRMDRAFDELHRYIKRDVALRKQVRKALIYPMILMFVSIAVVAIIVVFVIPRFAEFFEGFGAELPLPTRILMAIADFVQSTAGLITLGVIVVAVLCSSARSTPARVATGGTACC